MCFCRSVDFFSLLENDKEKHQPFIIHSLTVCMQMQLHVLMLWGSVALAQTFQILIAPS